MPSAVGGGSLVRLAALLAAAAVLGGCADASRPNLLLVTIDTLRADHVSAYGYPRPTTPALDALAAQGTRFALAYTPMATTGPAHASLFTGLYPIEHRIVKNGLRLGEEHDTLAELLAARGYACAAVVSSFVLDAKFGYAQGFDTYQDDFDRAGSTVKTPRWEGIAVEGGFDRRADRTTAAAVDWLRERPRDRPFFLFVHYFDPHSPYVPPPALAARFGADRAAPGRERAIALYDGEIAFADLGLARLIETLREEGLDEDTLVVVTGDHGEGLLDHGYMFHGVHIYEEAVHVPLVFRWPGTIPAGRTIAEPVELVHVAPSVLDLLGLEEEARALPGRSFAPALRGEDALDAQAPVYLQRRHFRPTVLGDPDDGGLRVRGEKFGVRIGEWKYIVGPEEKSEELFQLGDDPGERVNLVGELPRKAAELSARLAAWREARGPSGAPVDRVAEEDREALEALGYVE